MNARIRWTRVLLICIVAVIVAVPALIIYNRPHYLAVPEIHQNAATLNGKQVRIFGQHHQTVSEVQQNATALNGEQVQVIGPDYLAISEVQQNAVTLNGKQIRVRGQSVFRGPSIHAMFSLYGGCSVTDDPDSHHTGATLSLYEMDAPVAQPYNRGFSSESLELNRNRNALPHVTLSDDSLRCKGDDCNMTCSPFDPEAAPAFEFVGILRMDARPDGIRLFLDAIDLSASWQWVNEAWQPIPETTVTYRFP